jgi:hypothetical protein
MQCRIIIFLSIILFAVSNSCGNNNAVVNTQKSQSTIKIDDADFPFGVNLTEADFLKRL